MVALIIDTMSPRRFDTYLHAAGHNQERALLLYLWNAKLGASFHIPIQAVEVALRNRINHALVAEFGHDWWSDTKFNAAIDRERIRDLDTVKARITRRGNALETDQIVAGLSFGFWVGMLQPRYNPPIWGTHLRTSFVSLPARETRHSLFKLGGDIANFRNRISHHEPLLKIDAMLLYSEIIKMIRWLCPRTALWIKPHCDVPKIVRQKP
jgi:hypothetical protein